MVACSWVRSNKLMSTYNCKTLYYARFNLKNAAGCCTDTLRFGWLLSVGRCKELKGPSNLWIHL